MILTYTCIIRNRYVITTYDNDLRCSHIIQLSVVQTGGRLKLVDELNARPSGRLLETGLTYNTGLYSCQFLVLQHRLCNNIIFTLYFINLSPLCTSNCKINRKETAYLFLLRLLREIIQLCQTSREMGSKSWENCRLSFVVVKPFTSRK